MRGHEDRAAFGGEALQKVSHPADALRIEAVHGLVEHDGRGIPQQRSRDAEPLSHPERELPRTLASDVVQADQIYQLVDATARDPVCLRERQKMVVRRAACVNRARLQQRSDLVQRRRVISVVLSVDGHVARRRCVEPEDQAHRRRLAGTVGSKEARHDPRSNRKREVLDGTLVAVVLRQSLGLDHAGNPTIVT